jgi:pSer/pThr/pTyr-binding forkhead associated (FHA) protein
VSIISNETGQSVAAQALVSFSDVNTLPAVGLVPGSEYTLIVTAIDAQGQVLSEANAEFEYEPPPAQLTITEIQAPTAEQEAFLITVSSQNVGGAVKHTAWLIDEESQEQIEGSEITVPLGEPIIIPTGDLDAGSYLAVVQAIDSADTVLAESPPVKTTLTRAGLIERLGDSIGGSPLAIVGLTGFCLLSVLVVVAIVWFVLPKRGLRPGTVELVMPQKERRPAPGMPRPVQTPQSEPESPERTPPAAPQSKPQQAAAPERTPAVPHREPAQAAAPERTPAQGPRAQVRLMDSKIEFKAEMRKSNFTIGRKKTNDVALPLDSASGVSGEHLTITFENGQYYAQDNKSSYGTEIDGRLMDKGVPYLLRDGAVLTLGPKVSIEFLLSP